MTTRATRGRIVDRAGTRAESQACNRVVVREGEPKPALQNLLWRVRSNADAQPRPARGLPQYQTDDGSPIGHERDVHRRTGIADCQYGKANRAQQRVHANVALNQSVACGARRLTPAR
jgi:hypothetical protein